MRRGQLQRLVTCGVVSTSSSSSSSSAGKLGSKAAALAAGESGSGAGGEATVRGCTTVSEAAEPTTCGSVCTLVESTMSKMTAVMLSGPPALRARAISSSAASPGSSTLFKMDSMVSLLTSPDRPSEHSSQRSPTLASRIDSSSMTSPWASPSTRSSTERWGWCEASSRVSRPVSTRYSTKVWSRVTCSRLPSRSW